MKITKMIVVLIGITMLMSGCATLQPAENKPVVPVAETKAAVPAPTADGSNTKINVPNWPMIGYVSPDGMSFVILGIKEPAKFPVPSELEFKSKDGKQVVKMRPLDPPKEK